MFSLVRRVLRGFVLAGLVIALVPVTAFVTVLAAFIFLPLPANLPEANEVLPSQPTRIYDINGNEIAIVAKYDQNVPIKPEDIPDNLKKALISSEDKSFYSHNGVDPRGALRALVADIQNESITQGGSTITQQYVKNVYTNKERTLERKIREAILASQLDRQLEKDEILYRYLNTVYMGDGAYGIGAAAQKYFRKPVKDLDPSESATLVGLIPAPSAWNPRDDMETAEARRKVVLNKMFEEGYLTAEQLEEHLARDLFIQNSGVPDDAVTMIATRQSNEVTDYPYFVDYVKKYLEAKYKSEAVYQKGLRVQTTMDPAIQSLAEQTVGEVMAGTTGPVAMALASVEPPTGYVKAIVGGTDFQQAQVNLALGGCPIKPGPNVRVTTEPTCWTTPTVTNGGTGRQPGSAFKAVVLAAAYEKGMQPTKVYAAPTTYYSPGCRTDRCAIRNYEGQSFRPIDVKEAMADSVNTVYAPLTRDAGFDNVANMAKKLGVTSAFYAPSIHGDNGNYGLGTIDVSPLDMAAAYSVFANRGLRHPITPVVTVADAEGNVLEDNSNRAPVRVIDEAVADNVTDALRGVITEGTARSGDLGRDAAGKTGTTEDYHDAWFVGYTPTLSTAVWMGNSTNVQTINYKGNRRVTGGSIPTQTWAKFMKAALKDVPPTNFAEPAPIKPPAANVVNRTTVPMVPSTIGPSVRRPPITLPPTNFDRTSSAAAVSPATTAPPGGRLQSAP